MTDHITAILEASSKLEDAGFPLLDEVLCSALLGSLPRDYDVLVTSIEGRNASEITVDYVREKILEENKKRDRNPTSSVHDTRALYTNIKNHETKTKPHIKCYYCQKVGHIRKDCRLLKNHSAHSDFTRKNKNSNPDHARIMESSTSWEPRNTNLDTYEDPAEHTTIHKALTTGKSKMTAHTGVWIVDTGATDHMCNDIHKLHNITQINPPMTVMTASGESHLVTTRGDCTLTLTDIHGADCNIILNKVLLVPALTDQLLSIARMDEEGFTVTFKNKESWLDTGNKRMLLGTLRDKLYIVENRDTPTIGSTHLCKHVWHSRLGHRNAEDIEKMRRENLAEGLNITPCSNDGLCAPCAMGKMANAPFQPNNHKKGTKPFEILYSDLVGPISPSSLGGNEYILAITDEFSRYSYTYMLRTKDQTTDCVIDYIEKGTNRFKRRPKVFFSDGGGEFKNCKLDRYLSTMGTTHLTSLPHTPQENGSSERYNRTLMDATRTLLKQANLPDYLWGEIASSATYLINRVTHSSTGKSPYQLWYDQKPNLVHLKTLGTKCFFYNTQPHKKKLDNRGINGILIGYGESSSFYRIWQPDQGKIYQSRKVLFTAEQCPYLEQEHVLIPDQIEPSQSNGQETSREKTNENNNIPTRRSSRTNIGKAPLILTYDQLGVASPTQQDWFNKTQQSS